MKSPTIASVYPFPGNADYCHDVNFSLIHGATVYSAEEAKFSTITNDYVSRYPERAMARGFLELGISPRDVDYWVFGQPVNVSEDEQLKLFFQSFFGSEKFANEKDFALFKEKKVRYVRHQLAHAALAVIGSREEKCSFLTLDGGGDAGDKTDSIFGLYTKEKGFELKSEDEQIQNGLGAFHTALTRTIGFSLMEDGKATGLAAYGSFDEEIFKVMAKFVSYNPDNNRVTFSFKRSESGLANFSKFKPNSYNRWKVWKSLNYESDFSNALKGYNPLDIARTGEQILVDYAKLIVSNIVCLTNVPFIALSGGVFQNVFLNSEIGKMSEISGVYVPSAPNDAGLSLGAALYLLDDLTRESSGIGTYLHFSAYIGPEFSDTEIEEEIRGWPVTYSVPENISSAAANSIAEGKIVGWFQGRQELGPRALGARSVLGNPMLSEIKIRVNHVLKKRDWFMPYAPSCLEEESHIYFDESPHAPYMSFALTPKTSTENLTLVKNISHVDGTSRAQFVEKANNPLYHEAISYFRELTGVPIVLNTSFNRHGIATIATPKQALEHLVCGNIEELYIGGFHVKPIFPIQIPEMKYISEELEILLISIEPYVQFYSGKTSVAPKPSKTLEIYLGKLELTLVKDMIVGTNSKFSISLNNESVRYEISKLQP
jgi:carbamoyltransferase